MLKLFNTLTRQINEFKPLSPSLVTMYTCGPTVYDYTHIGHLKKYVGDDLLKRVLIANGFQVKHVMNITDVGHLTSDSDSGDDKLEKGAKERNMTVWEVAKFFEDYFFKAVERVNIIRPDIVPRATEHVNEQIKLIEKLQEKGFTYITDEAVYFDVSKFSTYTKLSGQKLEEKEVGVPRKNTLRILLCGFLQLAILQIIR
jgi:cysteinyl-tRNA synthetase